MVFSFQSQNLDQTAAVESGGTQLMMPCGPMGGCFRGLDTSFKENC